MTDKRKELSLRQRVQQYIVNWLNMFGNKYGTSPPRDVIETFVAKAKKDQEQWLPSNH